MTTFYTAYEFHGGEAHEFRFESLAEIFENYDDAEYFPLIEQVIYAGGLDIRERLLSREEIITAHDEWESDREADAADARREAAEDRIYGSYENQVSSYYNSTRI